MKTLSISLAVLSCIILTPMGLSANVAGETTISTISEHRVTLEKIDALQLFPQKVAGYPSIQIQIPFEPFTPSAVLIFEGGPRILRKGFLKPRLIIQEEFEHNIVACAELTRFASLLPPEPGKEQSVERVGFAFCQMFARPMFNQTLGLQNFSRNLGFGKVLAQDGWWIYHMQIRTAEAGIILDDFYHPVQIGKPSELDAGFRPWTLSSAQLMTDPRTPGVEKIDIRVGGSFGNNAELAKAGVTPFIYMRGIGLVKLQGFQFGGNISVRADQLQENLGLIDAVGVFAIQQRLLDGSIEKWTSFFTLPSAISLPPLVPIPPR